MISLNELKPEKVFRHNEFGIVSFSKKEGIFDYGVIYVIDKHGNNHLCYKEDLIDDVSIDEQNEYWEYIS